MYLEGEQAYVVNNHIVNSQYHSFRSRLGYTYLANNFIENGANTEISIFGNPDADKENSHIVLIGNVITKEPHQRSDGLPGNKAQFIQIGGRGVSDANLYLYHNTFIMDQSTASDDGANHKNAARLVMFSDTETNRRHRVIAQNNVIWGSTGLAIESEAGKADGLFENNALVTGSLIPPQWNAINNTEIDSIVPPFHQYQLNENGLQNNPSDLTPANSLSGIIPSSLSSLNFIDRQGLPHSLNGGLFNEEDPFNFSFTGYLKQIAENKTSSVLRGTPEFVGAFESLAFVAETPVCDATKTLVNQMCASLCQANEVRNTVGNCISLDLKSGLCGLDTENVNDRCLAYCTSGTARNLLGECVAEKQCSTDQILFKNTCRTPCPEGTYLGDNFFAQCLTPANEQYLRQNRRS